MSILKVNNLNEKSFNNYTGPNCNFNQKNIVFGYNGRGKSSLALGIISEFTKNQTNKKENYRFFNRQFIDENLLLNNNDKSKIKGVTANFGKASVEIEKEILEIERAIIDTTKLNIEQKQLVSDIEKEIEIIFENKKGKSKIKRPSADNITSLINIYDGFVSQAKKIENSEDKLLMIKGDNSLELELESKRSLNITSIEYIDEKIIKKASEIFVKKFDDSQIPTSEIMEWLNKGIEIHQEGENCKFCGNNLNYLELKSKIDYYNSNEKQKASVFLLDFSKKILNLKNQMESFLKERAIVSAILNSDLSTIFNSISDDLKIVTSFIELTNSKIQSINKEIVFDEVQLIKINKSAVSNFIILNKIKEDEIKELDNKINQMNILIKGSIGLEIQKNSLITKYLNLLNEKEVEKNIIEEENRTSIEKIDSLKKKKSNKNDFAEHINIILKNLEIDLKLELFEENYFIKHSKLNSKLNLNDISEGEQNLLALLYFYYELFNDKEQKDFKSEIKIIVMDDPISSVDDTNRMYILALIKSMISDENYQLFVFTHVWEDFCNLAYGINKNITSCFEIKKNNDGSYIEKTKESETPYKHEFKEIYEFSNLKDVNDLEDCQIYHYPNAMRKILEEFLSFKVSNSNATIGNVNNIIKVLCDDNPSVKEIQNINTLLNVCNIFSHKISRNPQEILSSAKFLMSKIRKVDKNHYDTNKN